MCNADTENVLRTLLKESTFGREDSDDVDYELLSVYLEQRATPEECQRVASLLRADPELRRILDIARDTIATDNTATVVADGKKRRLQKAFAVATDWLLLPQTVPRLAFGAVTIVLVCGAGLIIFMCINRQDDGNRVYRPRQLRGVAITGAPTGETGVTNTPVAAPTHSP